MASPGDTTHLGPGLRRRDAHQRGRSVRSLFGAWALEGGNNVGHFNSGGISPLYTLPGLNSGPTIATVAASRLISASQQATDMFEGVRIGTEDLCHRRSRSRRHSAAPRRVDLERTIRHNTSVPPDVFTYRQSPPSPKTMKDHVASCSNYMLSSKSRCVTSQ